MSKKRTSVIAVYAIVLVLFNVLFFAVPFAKAASGWVCWGFSLLAVILGCGVSLYAFSKGEGLKSKIYGFPVFRMGAVYTIVQLVFSVVMFIVGSFVEAPVVISIVVSALILGICGIGFIGADNARDIVEEQVQSVEASTRQMKYFRVSADGIADICADSELKKQVAKFAEELKYSDPVSSDETASAEKQINEGISQLRDLVSSDPAAAKIKAAELSTMLADRNRICKAFKK